MFSGMPQIFFFLAPAATPAANVPTNFNRDGDGPRDSDGDDATDTADDGRLGPQLGQLLPGTSRPLPIRGKSPSASGPWRRPLFAIGQLRIPAFALSDVIHAFIWLSRGSPMTINPISTPRSPPWARLSLPPPLTLRLSSENSSGNSPRFSPIRRRSPSAGRLKVPSPMMSSLFTMSPVALPAPLDARLWLFALALSSMQMWQLSRSSALCRPPLGLSSAILLPN